MGHILPCTTCGEDIDTSVDDQLTWRKASQGREGSWVVHRGDCLVTYTAYVKACVASAQATRADMDARITASEARLAFLEARFE
jgi:hypothetical protein